MATYLSGTGSSSKIQMGSDTNNYLNTRLPNLADTQGTTGAGNGTAAYQDFLNIPTKTQIIWINVSEYRTLGTAELALQAISFGSPVTDPASYNCNVMSVSGTATLSGAITSTGYIQLTKGTTTNTYWQGLITLVRHNTGADVTTYGQNWILKWHLTAAIWTGSAWSGGRLACGTGTLNPGVGTPLSGLRMKSSDGTTMTYGGWNVQYA